MDFPGGSVVKNPPASAGDARDTGLIPGLGRSPGVGNGNLLQYSCPENPWTEEPGGLQSLGSQGVGQDSACAHTTHRHTQTHRHTHRHTDTHIRLEDG